MSVRISTLLLALALLLGPALPAWAAPAPPALNAPFPAVAFPAPADRAAREYLGLAPDQELDLAQVPGRLVIVEFFNMYCPHCQKEAPRMNQLYKMIQDKGWGDKVKLLAIGARNSAFEVKVYAKHYKAPYPLVADPKLQSLKALGEVYTPHYVVILREASGGNRVIYSQSGPLPELDKFLAGLAARAGLK